MKNLPIGPQSVSNIYSWLDGVRDRPAMYVRSLQELKAHISGYYLGLENNGIVESVPSMDDHFNAWACHRRSWPGAMGWSHAIESRVSDFDKQFATFFRLVDKYRQFVPTTLRMVRLLRRHQPTGKRVRISVDGLLDGRMKKPSRIEIIRYHPEPLHFLRFHYRQRIMDDTLLENLEGINTTMDDAKRWVKDEFQVKRTEWIKLSCQK